MTEQPTPSSRVLTIVVGLVIVGILAVAIFRLAGRHEAPPDAAADQPAPSTTAAPPAVTVPAGVRLSAAEEKSIGLRTAKVDVRTVAPAALVTGAVRVRPESQELVGSRVPGRIVHVAADVGDRVTAGQVLATVQSAEFENLQVEFLRTAAELPVLQAAAARMKELLAIEAVAEKDARSAAAQFEARRNELEGQKARLRILGLSDADVARLQETQRLVETLPVAAHVAGVVVSRSAVAGSPVDASTPIFEIDDLSTLWIEGDVFESQLQAITPGLAVGVTVPAYPAQVFHGTVAAVMPWLEPDKHTARLRVALPNPAGLLKPGMFATLSIGLRGGASGPSVPVAALIERGTSVFVFVRNGDEYVRQDVVVAARDDQYARVARGLVPHDVVVTDGKMQIYAKSLVR